MKSGFIAITGRPNVGKSTLVNSLMGLKITAVSPKPQTTRIRITGIIHLPEAQIILWDCPGLFQTKDDFNKKLIKIALASLYEIDIILWIIDCTSLHHKDDEYILHILKRTAKHAKSNSSATFLLINKIDKINKKELLPLIDYYKDQYNFAEIIPISALKGINVDLLKNKIIEYLPEGPQYFPDNTITDIPKELLLSEFIREKIYLHTHQEIPYATGVVINEIRKIDNKNMLVIHADIIVNRYSLKKILVGSKGQMIKKIGMSARQDIESFISNEMNPPPKVYLELFVKVKENWKDDAYLMQSMGLIP